MARHKAKPAENTLEGWSQIIKESGEQFRATHEPPLTLAQRLEQAKAKLEASVTVAEACYWQGAVDALEAFSAGWPMPTTIGSGITKA